ncbi:MAG: hypothetical protein COB15_05480 [Flavobacteriales bacterium]|nr:MAG: hypothetical protein COB15_05480 [Flavobacteriales bacterium]
MNKKIAIVTLILISILSGIIWRIEIEYHGWYGLTWISYFHLTIPIGFLLFMFWANFFIQLTTLKRALLNISALVYGLLIYISLRYSLVYLFGAGPKMTFEFLETPRWIWHLKGFSTFIIIPMIPVGTFYIFKAFGKIVPLKSLLISIIGLLISSPLSMVFLELINDKGKPDAIHTIKSGVIIPICMFSIGLLIIGQMNNTGNNKPGH